MIPEQYENAKAHFHHAALIIEQTGIGKLVERWLADHSRDILPLHDLEAKVALSGWLATLMCGFPLNPANVENLVNLFFDEYDITAWEVRDFTNRFLWTLGQTWPAPETTTAQV